MVEGRADNSGLDKSRLGRLAKIGNAIETTESAIIASEKKMASLLHDMDVNETDAQGHDAAMQTQLRERARYMYQLVEEIRKKQSGILDQLKADYASLKRD